MLRLALKNIILLSISSIGILPLFPSHRLEQLCLISLLPAINISNILIGSRTGLFVYRL